MTALQLMSDARRAERAAWKRLNAHEARHRCDDNMCPIRAALGDAWYAMRLTSGSFEWLLGRKPDLPTALQSEYQPDQKGPHHDQRR